MKSSPMTFGDLLIRAAAARAGLDPSVAPEIEAQVLRDLLEERQRRCPFQVGDVVEQIAHLARYKTDIGIVSRLLDTPIRADFDGTATDCDMIILVRMGGAVCEFAVESWRFRKREGA